MAPSQHAFTFQKVLVIPWKRWLRHDMTEKLLTGTLNLNKTKPNQIPGMNLQMGISAKVGDIMIKVTDYSVKCISSFLKFYHK